VPDANQATQVTTLDIGIVFGYLGLMVLLGLYANYRQQNVEDYFVAGRRLGPFSIGCLWLASWVGGASIIGSSAKAHEIGISAVWYVLSLAIGCFMFGLLFAGRVKTVGDRHQHLTYPDFIEKSFDSRTRIVATITTSLAFVAFAAGQLVAAGSIIHVLLGWDFVHALMLASGIVILYTATGGFLAVTYTDWVQFILLLIGVVIIGVPIAISNGGSPGELATALPDSYFDIGAWGWPTILALAVSVAMSYFVAMDSFTRCFAARDERTSRNGALLAVVFMLPIAVAATWLGLTSAVLFPAVESSNDILTTFVVELFPSGLKGLVVVGILAAVMSTADICILTVSANFTRDIYQRYINPEISKERMLKLGILASAIMGLAASLIAWKMQDIIDVLMFGFTLNGAALILPTIAAMYWKHTDPNAAFWSIVMSLSTVIAWRLAADFGLEGAFAIEPLWPGLFVSIATFLLLHRSWTPWRVAVVPE
jgi:SSS family solute:Na+ symporter